jgi:hypothetical protein
MRGFLIHGSHLTTRSSQRASRYTLHEDNMQIDADSKPGPEGH